MLHRTHRTTQSHTNHTHVINIWVCAGQDQVVQHDYLLGGGIAKALEVHERDCLGLVTPRLTTPI